MVLSVKNRYFAYLLILPSLVLFLSITAYPILYSVYLSFTNLTYWPYKNDFVGLANYIGLFQDLNFVGMIQSTVIFVVASLALGFGFSFAVALLLNEKIKYRDIFRALMLAPWIVPGVIVVLIWLTFTDPSSGLFNVVLVSFGQKPVAWLSYPETAMFQVILASVWKYSPFMTIGLLAGLQSIPRELYEAAKIDGANTFNRFIHITLPSMRSIILVLITIQTIWRVNHFDIIKFMTGGGPANSTMVPTIYAVQRLFSWYQYGYAAAISCFVGLVLISLIYLLIKKGGLL